MKCEISNTTMKDIKPLMEQYLNTINGVTDDFWEEHIVEAQFYVISLAKEDIGYFAIYRSDKITQFFMVAQYLNLAQPVFERILKEYNIKTAFVTTGDQLFLSLCMDFHKKVELQAYFFDGTILGEVKPAEYSRDNFIKVKPEELPRVKELTGDFFETVTRSQLETKECTLYKLCEKEEVLGYGIIVPNKLLTQYWALGMIVLEEHRQKGIGRSIQLHLGDITREQGFIPISGCWYYNHLSKKTIESAGRYTKTRLLNILF